MTNLPVSWSLQKVEDVSNNVPISNIKTKQKDYLESGKLPVIDQGQTFVSGYTNNEALKVPAQLPVIVFGDHTRIFKYVDFDFAPGADGTKILKPIAAYDPKLFFYFLKIIKLPDKGYSRHFQFLEKSVIPLPPLAEQKRIVAKIEELFTDLDAGVVALKKTKALIKQYRQSVLKSAFEGTMYPNWAPKHILLKDIVDVKGRVGWRGYKKTDLRDSGPLVIGVSQLTDKLILDLSDPVHVSEEKYLESPEIMVSEGDIIVAQRGSTLGKISIVNRNIGKATINPCVLLFKNIKVNRNYLLYMLASPEYQRMLAPNNNATAIPMISQEQIKNLTLLVPNKDYQYKIVAYLDNKLSLADAAAKNVDAGLKQAERLRQSILKKAFEGKLVPQDPKDEPAERLLARIKSEKAKAAESKVNIPKKKVSK